MSVVRLQKGIQPASPSIEKKVPLVVEEGGVTAQGARSRRRPLEPLHPKRAGRPLARERQRDSSDPDDWGLGASPFGAGHTGPQPMRRARLKDRACGTLALRSVG